MARADKGKIIPPLPVKQGIAPSYLWLPVGQWDNLLTFLLARFPAISREEWLSRMARGEVLNRRGERLLPDSQYRQGDCIFYYRELEKETPIPFEETILFQNEHLLVADKPHFLPVIPTGRFLQETLLVRLKKKTGLHDLTPIHRLDRETAGVVIFSLNRATRGTYQSLFQKRVMDKVYEALAPSRQDLDFPRVHRSCMVEGEPFFCMKEAEGLPNSETRMEIIEARGEITLYRLRPVTGKKHQLRVHMASLGIPILNDAFYPVALPCKGDDVSQPLKLLARSITFDDPVSGQVHYFASQRTL